VDINTILNYGGGSAAGTGIVLTSSGVVLTNNHVIEGATTIKAVDVGSGRTYTATVVGADKGDDIAVLQLQGASGLQTVPTGASSKVAVHDHVTAVGNAGGVGGIPSAAVGSVTALNQTITAKDEVTGSSEQLSGLIQIDAAVQAGDSGGPLINSSGEVIAIDTASSTGFQFQYGTSEGFAIPIEKALLVVTQIVTGQSSSTVHIGAAAFLGVELEPGEGSPASFPQSGARVLTVESGSPAQAVGITAGDVVHSFDGQSVDTGTSMVNMIQSHHPGDRVEIGWIDQSGAQHTAQVQLTIGPAI